MSVQVTHDDTIIINISLAAVPRARQSFTNVLILGDEANGTTLDGDRVRTYTSFQQVEADKAFIGPEVLEMARVAFLQSNRKPRLIKIGRVDTGGSPAETYADGLAAVSAVDDDWFGVVIESRLAADIVPVAQAVEQLKRLFIFQSGDGDWLGSAYPAAFEAIEGYQNSILVYHDDATAKHDVGWMASRLAFDPDSYSAPWEARIQGGKRLTTPLTATQLQNLRNNNANVALPFGGYDHYIDPGVTLEGRPIYEMVTAYWFYYRLRDRVADMKVKASDRGEKIVLAVQGQTMVRSCAETQLTLGVGAGHFVEGQTEAWADPLTDSDFLARRINVGARAQFAVSGRQFDFDVTFDILPIEEAA